MGAVFRLACEDFADFDAYRAAFPGQRLYPLMTSGRSALADARFEEPCALIFGNESSGLPDAFHDLGASLRIPTIGPIDSLSLPVSVGIALYEFVRQRS
jgi:TrmH family RNA methyltransferase